MRRRAENGGGSPPMQARPRRRAGGRRDGGFEFRDTDGVAASVAASNIGIPRFRRDVATHWALKGKLWTLF
jgi:hypothetical protein